MVGIKIKITAFISDNQPGFVECRFNDAWNKEFILIEKVSIVTARDLSRKSQYPQPGIIACEVLKKWQDKDGRQLVTISTERPWGIETIDGLTQFDILQKDLITY